MTEKVDKEVDDALLAEARKRLKMAIDAEQDNREAALDDLNFAWNADYQWSAAHRKIRGDRPCLTENRLPQFIRQIVNGMRANRPSIEVSPVRNASAPAALIMEGVIRHTEQYSKADLAIDNAAEYAVAGGFGYFRIATDYVDDESFDQDIVWRPIENPFSVYDDPHYEQPDASDRQWCFVTEWVNRDEFKARYGVDPVNVGESGLGDQEPIWVKEKEAMVAEYWRVVTTTDTVKAPGPDGKERTRSVERKMIEQYLITADTVVKRSEPRKGRLLPIIPIFGETITIDGKKLRKSLIRDAKDPQRMNNFFLSAETEAIALQPRTPFIGWEGQFDDPRWASANSQNHAYLEAKVVPNVPPQLPERQPPPTFPAAMRESRLAAIEAIKASMGIYDASLGARSNETSGVAIDERKQQGDLSTYHFPDNVARALRYAGLVIIDLIPTVYDQARIVRMVNVNGEAETQAVNSLFVDPQTYQMKPTPDLRVGTYDVVVKTGPGYATQREETTRTIAQLVRAYPPLAQLAGDILFRNLDFPGADEIAKRIEQANAKGQGALPPEVQQQIGQMQQALAQGKQGFDELQQVAREQRLALQEKDIQLRQKDLVVAGKDLMLRDKSAANANDRIEQISNDQKFIVDTLLKLVELQQKQQASVVEEAQAMRSGTEALVQ